MEKPARVRYIELMSFPPGSMVMKHISYPNEEVLCLYDET